jgi:hypothetical protein
MTLRQYLFRLLFGAEFRALQERPTTIARLERELRDLRTTLWRLKGPPAHVAIAAELTEEQIADRLAGTHASEPIKAVLAKIAAQIITLSDRATDAPRGEIHTREGNIPAFTNDDRLHVAGGAAYLAELLRDLQQLVRPRTIETAKEAAHP